MWILKAKASHIDKVGGFLATFFSSLKKQTQKEKIFYKFKKGVILVIIVISYEKKHDKHKKNTIYKNAQTTHSYSNLYSNKRPRN